MFSSPSAFRNVNAMLCSQISETCVYHGIDVQQTVINLKPHRIFFESMADDELTSVIILGLIHRRRRRKMSRKVWVQSIFTKRLQQSEFYNLLEEMRLTDPESHYQYLRMSKQRLIILCQR